MTTGRLRSIDAVRGIAMVLVIAAHSFLVCNPQKFSEFFLSGLWLLTQSASIAFMFVSGMIMTYLMLTGDQSPRSTWRFFRRGLFLIVVIHPVLRLVTFAFSNTNQDFFHNMLFDHPITDTIGFCLIVAPLSVRIFKPSYRLILIILMLFGAFGTKLWWHPESGLAMVLKVVLFGTDPDSETTLAVGWPVIPWLAIFLCGSFVGETYTAMRKNQIVANDAFLRFRKGALLLLSVGIALAMIYFTLKRLNPFAWNPATFLSLYPSRTGTLLPFYLGLILVVIAFLVKYVDCKGKYNIALWTLSIFGRNSLFTFVTQFVVVWTIPALLGLKGTLGHVGYAALLAIGLLLIWTSAYVYGRLRNRITANDYQTLLGHTCVP